MVFAIEGRERSLRDSRNEIILLAKKAAGGRGENLMEIEKLIERLNGLYTALREEGEQKCSPEINTVAFVLQAAATSLSTLQAETEKLRAEVEHWRNAHHQAALNFQQENRECNKVLAELERMKKIMRENGIMVIPSKYPGGQAEWDIPKP